MSEDEGPLKAGQVILYETVSPYYVPADDELCLMAAEGAIIWGREVAKRKKWKRQVDNVIRAVFDVVPLEAVGR